MDINERESLESLIAKTIEDCKKGVVGLRVESYTDYKRKYMILAPSVKVEIESTDGRVIVMDVTDYFEGIVR